jgi:uncharacterized protein
MCMRQILYYNKQQKTERKRKQMKLEELKGKLESQREDLQGRFFVKNIGIFGSFVRNTPTKKSDVDILVEFEKGHKDFFNYIRLKHYLEESFGRKVDLVIKDAVKPRLRDRIFHEVVYV